MNRVYFKGFNYTTENLPEGVIFVGVSPDGLVHQMTKNAEPAADDVTLEQEVGDAIEQAEAYSQGGTSLGFREPIFFKMKGTEMARCRSTLMSKGGLSFADNVFYFDANHRLTQVQCATRPSNFGRSLVDHEAIQKRLGNCIDLAIENGVEDQ